MKKMLMLLALAGAATTGFAAVRTVTLSVPGMTCPACPITVKKALNKVPGVTRTEVNYEARKATVTFDDTRTNVQALVQASTHAGFPATSLER